MKKKTLLVIMIIILLIIVFVIINKSKKEKQFAEQIEEGHKYHSSFYSQTNDSDKRVSILEDRNDFMTAQSCVNKYIDYITEKDADSVYKLIDKSYINKFGITKENVLNKVEQLTGNLRFDAEKIYYEEINESVTKYYVIGEITEERSEDFSYSQEMKITVCMDIDNLLFSIIPFGYGGTFNEEK